MYLILYVCAREFACECVRLVELTFAAPPTANAYIITRKTETDRDGYREQKHLHQSADIIIQIVKHIKEIDI